MNRGKHRKTHGTSTGDENDRIQDRFAPEPGTMQEKQIDKARLHIHLTWNLLPEPIATCMTFFFFVTARPTDKHTSHVCTSQESK